MKIPIVNLASGEVVPETLPAAAAVAANGFLSCACPVIRCGTKRAWRLMLLVRYETRTNLYNDLVQEDRARSEDLIDRRLAPTDTCEGASGAPNVDTRGKAASWTNADSQWLDARWTAGLVHSLKSPCNGSVLLLRCAEAAIALAGGDAEGGQDVERRRAKRASVAP